MTVTHVQVKRDAIESHAVTCLTPHNYKLTRDGEPSFTTIQLLVQHYQESSGSFTLSKTNPKFTPVCSGLSLDISFVSFAFVARLHRPRPATAMSSGTLPNLVR